MESRQQLVGHGIKFDLGEPVTVKVAEVDPVTAGLSFHLVEGGTQSAGRPPKHAPKGPPKGKGAKKAHRKGRAKRR
jgi:hypothetical protein